MIISATSSTARRNPSLIHPFAQMLERDLASYNQVIEELKSQIDQVNIQVIELRLKRDELNQITCDYYQKTGLVWDTNIPVINELKVKRAESLTLLRAEVSATKVANDSNNQSEKAIHKANAESLRSTISDLDKQIKSLWAEYHEAKNLHNQFRDRYSEMKQAYNKQWAMLNELKAMLESLKAIQANIINSLSLIAQNNALLVGVPPQHINNMKIKIDINNQSYDYLFGGIDKPDGINHLHINADIYGNIKYTRLFVRNN